MWKQVGDIRDRIRGACLTERPAGSFTIEEYCIRFGICINTAQHQLARMTGAGALRKARVLLPDSIGRMVMRTVYTPIAVRSV